jgi:hypothetical protein
MLYKFWRFVGKLSVSKVIYQKGRDLFLFLRLAKHSGRQKYSIGFLKNGFNLRKYLELRGFENSYYSWIDDGEVLSMRKVEKGFQYHIRLFEDMELRGHYEYVPDGFPLKHLREICFKRKKKYFSSLLKLYLKK